jgi:hypothetical protein
MSLPSLGSQNNQSENKWQAKELFHDGLLFYSSTLKMKTTFSETSVDLQRITLRYIPEGRTQASNTTCMKF